MGHDTSLNEWSSAMCRYASTRTEGSQHRAVHTNVPARWRRRAANSRQRGGLSMSVCVVHRLSAACVAAAALTASATASASYYGVLLSPFIPNGPADEGAWVQIFTDKLFSNTCNQWVNHEMWYGTDG